MFICLNPSTADEDTNDNTVRRMVGFAKKWGYGTLLVLNAFAFRSPYPKDLKTIEDPVGPENDWWIKTCAEQSSIMIGAWGNHAVYKDRSIVLKSMFNDFQTFGVTSKLEPKHPLYVSNDAMLIPYSEAINKPGYTKLKEAQDGDLLTFLR